MGTFPCTLASRSSLGECARRATRLLHNQDIAQCTLFTRGHTIPEVQSQGKGWAVNCGKSGLERLILCLALTGPAESPPRSEFAWPSPVEGNRRGHTEKKVPRSSLWYHHSCSDAHPASALPGLHFRGRLIFYS